MRVSLLLLALVPLGGQAIPDARFERVSLSEGLSQSAIQAIAQCDDGFLWFGTQFGLDRYDGYEFQSWRHQPGNPDSLSNSSVTDLLASSRSGYLWVATLNGLNRFDTRTGRAERFAVPVSEFRRGRSGVLSFHAEGVDGTLYMDHGGQVVVWHPGSRRVVPVPFSQPVTAVQTSEKSAVLDQRGRFWLFNSAGLWRMDVLLGVMELVMPLADSPDEPLYNALALTADGLLAMAKDDRLLLVDPDTLDVVRRIRSAELGAPREQFFAVLAASDGSLWLSLSTQLVRYDPDAGQVTFRTAVSPHLTRISERRRVNMIEHANGDLWFYNQYAVARWRDSSQAFQVFRHDPHNPHSIPSASPGRGYTVFIDQQGTVWVGSRTGGVGRYTGLADRFEHILDLSPPGAIPHAGLNVVRDVIEQTDNGGEHVWLALDYGGVRRVRRRNDGIYDWVSSFHRDAESHRRLPGDTVVALVADRFSDLIWVLEEEHLIAIDSRTDRVVSTTPIDPWSGGGRAETLKLSPDGAALWVGTTTGLYEFFLDEDRLGLEANPLNPLVPGLRIKNMLGLAPGRVLVGGGGLAIVDLTDPDRSVLLSELVDDMIYGLARHHEEGWWLGTRNSGLAHLRPTEYGESGFEVEIEWYGQGAGLVDQTVYAILPESDGRLWLSTNRGLMRWNPSSFEVSHYTPADGIQSYEFQRTAASIGPSGRYYFGGINGVNAFHPDRVRHQPDPPRVHLQDVSVPGVEANIVHGEVLHLDLRHDQNEVRIQFVGLHSSSLGRLRYAYRMEGLDREWVKAGSQRHARYAGLSPGRYRFHVRAANSDGVWSEDELLLTLLVRPSPWSNRWAYSAYVLMALGVLGLLSGLNQRRRRELEAEVQLRTARLTEQQAVIQRQAKELEQALDARTLFFANISHEFRTPLTLIEASLERLQAEGGDTEAIEHGRRYLRRLLSLVDQLLELARLRGSRETGIGPAWSLASVIRFTVDAFQPLATRNDVQLQAKIRSNWITRCSQEHVEKILLNLITNALKFCTEQGHVTVTLEGRGTEAVIEVADDGPGISAEEQALIFQRFHRSDSSRRNRISGAGIGLALVREAAVAMDGRVEVESALGEGSRFRVYLPATMADGADTVPTEMTVSGQEALGPNLLEETAEYEVEESPPVTDGTDKAKILVVDNNAELRHHLRDVLSSYWQVIEAEDGLSALSAARNELPDLIVSDIMMPRMDGFELLAALRDDIETSHIPVLLLTARRDTETRLRGLNLRADDFLSKPFDSRELLLRLRRMAEIRDQLRRRFSDRDRENETNDPNGGSELSSRDRSLLETINRTLDEQATDPDFAVDDLADAVLLERRTLQRKLKALTGLTPADFIRQFRFRQATRMMLESDKSINEIAFASGFGSPQHFSRAFRKQYGMPPDQWRKDQEAPLKA